MLPVLGHFAGVRFNFPAQGHWTSGDGHFAYHGMIEFEQVAILASLLAMQDLLMGSDFGDEDIGCRQ